MIRYEYLNLCEGQFNMAAIVTAELSFKSEQDSNIHENLLSESVCI